MRSLFELLSAVLVLVNGSQDSDTLFLCRQRNRARYVCACLLGCLNNPCCGLIQRLVVIGLQLDSDFCCSLILSFLLDFRTFSLCLYEGFYPCAFTRVHRFCLLGTRRRVFHIFLHKAKSTRIPSPVSGTDNSLQKLPDSSATSCFIAFLQSKPCKSEIPGFAALVRPRFAGMQIWRAGYSKLLEYIYRLVEIARVFRKKIDKKTKIYSANFLTISML